MIALRVIVLTTLVALVAAIPQEISSFEGGGDGGEATPAPGGDGSGTPQPTISVTEGGGDATGSDSGTPKPSGTIPIPPALGSSPVPGTFKPTGTALLTVTAVSTIDISSSTPKPSSAATTQQASGLVAAIIAGVLAAAL